jgi:hypothetical protein
VHRQQRQHDVDSLRRLRKPRIDDPVATIDRALLDAREVQCAALTGAAALRRTILRMNAAHAHRLILRREQHRVADRHAARHHGAGHDRALAREREDTIDRETEQARSSRFIRHAAAAACRCAVNAATPGSSARTAQVSNTGASIEHASA